MTEITAPCLKFHPCNTQREKKEAVRKKKKNTGKERVRRTGRDGKSNREMEKKGKERGFEIKRRGQSYLCGLRTGVKDVF